MLKVYRANLDGIARLFFVWNDADAPAFTPDRGLAPQQIDADLYLFVGVLCFVDGRDDALEYVGVAKVHKHGEEAVVLLWYVSDVQVAIEQRNGFVVVLVFVFAQHGQFVAGCQLV